MDRRCRNLRPFVIFAYAASLATFLLAACTSPKPEPIAESATDIVELKWLAPGADAAMALTRLPARCISYEVDPVRRALIRKGELAFNNPFLLGGQAAKAGLYCGACHRNGHGNADFIFPGISGEPGTADVTNGLFGPDRADDVFNPVPIPDLTLPSGQSQVDRTRSDEIRAFLIAQVTEEFSGVKPSPEVLNGLVTYLQANDGVHCGSTDTALLTWRHDWQAALDAIAIGTASGEEAEFYRQAARVSLGRLHARYGAPDHQEIRVELERLSRLLGEIESGTQLVFDTKALEAQLAAGMSISYYNRETLAASLERETAR